MTRAPYLSSGQLRTEIVRIVRLLAALLSQQRRRGRTPVADAVEGLVIEEGEAEGLVGELYAEWEQSSRVPETAQRPAFARPEQPAGSFHPLYHAARTFSLCTEEFNALVMAVAAELDPRFGRLMAYLNDHVARTRPTIGLALSATRLEGFPEVLSPVHFCERPLVRDGLLELEGDGPLPGLSLRVPRELLRQFLAESLIEPAAADVQLHPPDYGLAEHLVLAEEVRYALRAWGEALRAGRQPPPLVLSGHPGSGRTSAAWAAASLAGIPLLIVKLGSSELLETARVARRDARWYGALLLIETPDDARASTLDWSLLWSELSYVQLPPLLALPPSAVDGAASAAPREPAVVSLADPDVETRCRLWQALLPPGSAIEPNRLGELAGRYRFNPGRIVRTLRRAMADVSLLPEGEQRLSSELLEQACRQVGSAAMGPLAQKLPLPYCRRDLVVPATVEAELDLALAWVRHQRKVLHGWGFARRLALGRGLTALFAGPPGTGKTMAAQVLARELALDLYRVDLSRVMSKYIGETEKNLARLFDEAQAAGAVLFFDEADALFGKRSAVKDAHDRYANVEIGYLLQRMEEYEGATVLATNRMRDLDDAFVRRFQVIVDFPMPGEAERLRIWEGMLPPEVERAADVDLARLAKAFETSGGEIRNSVLAAAYMAVAEGAAIGMQHLARALGRELQKSGRLLDDTALASLTDSRAPA